MIFENNQLPLTSLPAVQDVEFQRLSPSSRDVDYIGTALFWGFVFFGWALFFFLNNFDNVWIDYGSLGLWAVLFGLSMFVAGKRYACAGYALREHDIIHKHGVWWRTVTSIPFNRIQHCEISQGPVENAFDLATLRVFTAGGSSSDLAIDGLPHDEAVRMKEFITQKIGAAGSGVEE